MAPPRFAAEFPVNVLEATVVARLSTSIAPPVATVDWLLVKADVAKLAEPVPMPPGVANDRVTRSAPPPPQQSDAAVLCVNVVPVTVRNPVPPACMGDEGVYITPPPLVCT